MANCFALYVLPTGKLGCKAIKADCDGKDESCPFFKTKEQHEAEVNAANERIGNLSKNEQEYISAKYYRFTMPWRPAQNNGPDNAVPEMMNV